MPTDVWLLVDPVQDYEETLTILGVYGSLEAAKTALPRLRRKPYAEGGHYGEYSSWRDSEAQHWRGDQCVETWIYRHRSEEWRRDRNAD